MRLMAPMETFRHFIASLETFFRLYENFGDFCALHGANEDILYNSYHHWRHLLHFMTTLVIFRASWRQWRHFIQFLSSLETFFTLFDTFGDILALHGANTDILYNSYYH